MSSQSQRGAVSIVAVILVGIIALGFGALWFATQQENARNKLAKEQAEARIAPTEAKLAFAKSAYSALAKLLGPSIDQNLPEPEGWDKEGSVMVDDAAVLGRKMDEIKAGWRSALEEVGDKATAPGHVRETIDNLLLAYKAQKTNRVDTLEAQVKTHEATIASLQQQIADCQTKGADDLAQLRTESENQAARLNQQLAEANAQRDEAQGQNRRLTEEIGSARETANKEVLTARSQMRTLDAQVSGLKSDLRTQRERDVPDGRVLAVNRNMKTAFIDLGGKHQLRRGTAFKVYDTRRPGDKVYRGRIVVTNVGTDQSEVAIESEQDSRGIEEGDAIVNPVFDKAKQTRFVFLGDFNGRMSKEMAVRVLESAGAKVDDQVSVLTDFVVLGVKDAPESPELTESDAYKQAQAWGIEIIRARDLDPFLQY